MEWFLEVAREWGPWVALALVLLEKHGVAVRDWFLSLVSTTYRRKLEAEAEAAKQAVSREDRLFSALEKMVIAITQNTTVGQQTLTGITQIVELLKEQGEDLAELFGYLKKPRGNGRTKPPAGVPGD